MCVCVCESGPCLAYYLLRAVCMICITFIHFSLSHSENWINPQGQSKVQRLFFFFFFHKDPFKSVLKHVFVVGDDDQRYFDHLSSLYYQLHFVFRLQLHFVARCSSTTTTTATKKSSHTVFILFFFFLSFQTKHESVLTFCYDPRVAGGWWSICVHQHILTPIPLSES